MSNSPNFDNFFNKRFNHIEKSANRVIGLGIVAWIFGAAVSIAVLIFLGWVIIRVMQHFGII